mmetsp:Transcript_34309/g.52692  ORF Transcript_34309/g.52692 Transcript_34309/m.52692 type:complete len:90 (-) Transcript_34309:47-316(-)
MGRTDDDYFMAIIIPWVSEGKILRQKSIGRWPVDVCSPKKCREPPNGWGVSARRLPALYATMRCASRVDMTDHLDFNSRHNFEKMLEVS